MNQYNRMKCSQTTIATILMALWCSHVLNDACPEQYENVSGHCLHFGQRYLSFASAWQQCRLIKGVPVTIETSEKMGALITYLLEKPKANYWIGASDNTEQGVWRWVQSGRPMHFRNWCRGEPNNVEDNEHCTSIDSRYNYCWNDWKCADQLLYICELDEPDFISTNNKLPSPTPPTTCSRCPTPYVDLQGTCYYASLQKLNFLDASTECGRRNGVLASIESEDKQYAIANYVNEYFTSDYIMWIGASDAIDEGVWRWKANEQPLIYNRWCEGQPDNWLNNQHCAVLRNGERRCWDDDYCSQKFGYVCELKTPNSS